MTVQLTVDPLVAEYTAGVFPCHIEHTGPVDTALLAREGEVVHFRGRKLVGVLAGMGEHVGYVVAKDDSDPDTTRYTSVAQFLSVCVYGHDTAPEPSQWLLVGEMLDVADAIHA